MFLGWVLRSEFLKLLVVCGGGFCGLLLWVFFGGYVDFNWGVVVGCGFGLMGSNFSSDFAREIFRL